jgi:hypothetical protein
VSAHPSLETLSHLDGMASDRRRELLQHVRACSACCAQWAASDPTRLFAMLSTREVPADLLDSVSEGVFAAIDSGTASRPGVSRTWNLRAAGALAAGILLALGMVFFTGGTSEVGSPVPSVADLVEIAPGASLALLDTPGEARVVDLTMGEAQVVMIFDQELDL